MIKQGGGREGGRVGRRERERERERERGEREREVYFLLLVSITNPHIHTLPQTDQQHFAPLHQGPDAGHAS